VWWMTSRVSFRAERKGLHPVDHRPVHGQLRLAVLIFDESGLRAAVADRITFRLRTSTRTSTAARAASGPPRANAVS
jgi:hypothetical protein